MRILCCFLFLVAIGCGEYYQDGGSGGGGSSPATSSRISFGDQGVVDGGMREEGHGPDEMTRFHHTHTVADGIWGGITFTNPISSFLDSLPESPVDDGVQTGQEEDDPNTPPDPDTVLDPGTEIDDDSAPEPDEVVEDTSAGSAGGADSDYDDDDPPEVDEIID